jgi:hypothetical protein
MTKAPPRLGGKRRWLVWCAIGFCVVVAVIGATQKRRILGWLRNDVHVPDPPKEQLAAIPVIPVVSLTDAERGELAAAGNHQRRAAWSVLDSVSIYQRAGHVEQYGTDFRERRSRPVALDRSVFQVNADAAFLIWWPERNPVIADAELLEIELAGAAPTHGAISTGLVLANGEAHTFGFEFAAAPRTAPGLPFFPEDFRAALQTPTAHGMARDGARLRAVLPMAVRDQLKQSGDRAVRCWFLHLGGLAGAEVAIKHVSLLAAGPDAAGTETTLAGSIRGGDGQTCTLSALTESGKLVQQKVVGGGRFSLAGIPACEPVSLRVDYQAQEYYADAGRWFVPGGGRSNLVIHLAPSFVNLDKHKPNPKDRVANHGQKAGYAEIYQIHARQVWNGDEQFEQQFEGRSFSNNIGHLDRDRFLDNPDQSFRIVYLGSSHAVACQVRLCDRYNLIMETDLGVRLQRPVEVISLGRNNGDLAANYPRIRDYAVQFRPDAILLEHGSFLSMQVHPELLRRLHGYDAAHTHLDNFFYDDHGTLVHRPSCSDWPLYVQPKDASELAAGIPFADSLRVPFPHMHRFAREDFQYVADIMRFYQRQFPGMRFLLCTGLDQAHAKGKSKRTARLADGSEIPIGAEVFMKNMDELAAKEGFVVLQPRIPMGFNDTLETFLTFADDGHYAPRGHQWLAKELTEELMRWLKSQNGGVER